MEGSILSALCYSFMWCTLYFTLCLLNTRRSYEWHCRTVTALHASTVSIMTAWCGFVQGPWPFTDIGELCYYVKILRLLEHLFFF